MTGTCDWGECDDVAVALRFDRLGHGWLPVCQRHTETVDEDDPSAPIRLAPLPKVPLTIKCFEGKHDQCRPGQEGLFGCGCECHT